MTAYDAQQFIENYPPGIERHWWQSARNRMIDATLRRGGLRGQRLLEVGCGTGVVVADLRRRGWEITGCDLGRPEPLAAAAPFLALGTDAGDLPESTRHGIAVLLLCDVIEHVEDAPAFLRGLADSFPNAHTLLITVPARHELWSNYDEHFGHFRRYDRDMLQRELAAAGLRLDRCRHAFHALYWVMRLLNRMTPRSVRFQPPGRPRLHALIAAAFALEARLLPGGWWGASLIGLAKRSEACVQRRFTFFRHSRFRGNDE